ncbi:PhoP regulatory network protein YrbL [Bordetella hinzii CA90 BAL1384]|nr:PhoP regulatory network protein YrbL [Bordetella hinzii CA90 BAL1384]
MSLISRQPGCMLQTPQSLPPLPVEESHFHDVFGPIDLSHAAVLAQGGDRYVFEHPHDSCLLIKIMDMQARGIYLAKRPFKRWYKQFQREGAYRVYLNEFNEYVSSATRPSGVWRLPLARVLGVAQTNLGLGLLVEKIRDAQGGMAPSLRDLAGQGRYTGELASQLDQLIEDLADAHVVLHDLSPGNIAVGYNADGKHGLYLVDGFGVMPLIPFQAWSRRLNRRRILKKYAEMRAKLPVPQAG